MNTNAHTQWQAIFEEEENQWKKGHLQFSSNDNGQSNPPSVLDQCHNITNLHGYFSNLESRKCCLKLASVNTTFCTIRLVNETSSSNGSLGRGNQPIVKTENGRLSDKDFWVYRRALFGANFPVLSVPDPPTEPTPAFHDPSSRASNSSPEQMTMHTRSTEFGQKYQSSSKQELFDNIKYKFQTSLSDIMSNSTSMTSGIDSMESVTEIYLPTQHDSDEMAVLPAEVLADWHRKVYGLSLESARQYERKIYEPHRKRTFAKILVEELCRQLSLLETDSHPFYNSRMFMSREAYGRWQQRERVRISHMVSKFWHHSLPTVKHSNHLDVAQYHEDYRGYLHKIVAYETAIRKSNGNGELGPQMSSVSKRLLKEFALRYGIRDLYERIVYLELLTDSFSSSPGCVQQVIGEVATLKDLLPKRMAKSVLVVTEYEILTNALDGLQGHCKNILTRIKRIYEHSEILIGVGGVIHLLALIVELREHLDVDNSPTLKQLLEVYTKENLHTSYERHKIIAMNDLKIDPRTAEVTPKLINRLVINLKDEVLDYQRNYAPAYQRYIDVVKFAGSVLYDLLMEDVTNFCVTTNNFQVYLGIELPVLGVVYRLDQLDRDNQWADIVPCTKHTWRREFYTEILHWVKMLENHAQMFVLQSVGSDTFDPFLTIASSDSEEDFHLLQGSRCTSTNSQASLTPSQFSAFSTVRNYRSLQVPIQSDHKDEEITGNKKQDMRRPSPGTRQKKQTATLHNTERLNFHTQSPSVQENLKFSSKNIHSSASSLGMGSSRCKSVPLPSFVEFSERLQQPEMCRSCDDSCFIDTGYYTHFDSSTQQASLLCSSSSRQEATLHEDIEGLDNTDGGLSPVLSHKCDLLSDIDLEPKVKVKSPTTLKSTDLKQELGVKLPTTTTDVQPQLKVKSPTVLHPVDFQQNMDKKMTTSLKQVPEMYGHIKVEQQDTDSDDDEINSLTNEFVGFDTLEPRRFKPTTSAFIPAGITKPLNSDQIVDIPVSKVTSMPNIGTKHLSKPSSARHRSGDSPISDAVEEDISEAPLLVSSSMVELALLIKRMIHYVKTLCDTVYPLKMCSTPVADMNEELATHLKHSLIMRWKLTQLLLENIGSIVTLYSYNMMCVDLCGETNSAAKAIIGTKHVEEVKNLYHQKLIWGCRHKYNKQTCNVYPKKKAGYLADKFEPITQKMCTRINNLMELSGLIGELLDTAKQTLSLDLTIEAAAKYNIVFDEGTDYKTVKETIIENAKGLIRLMVYRMNLFTGEALVLLHQLQVPRYLSMESIYKPIIKFHRNHALILKKWINEVAYNEMVKNWWKELVQLMEDLVKNLINKEKMTIATAKRLLQLIANLMRFLCGRHVQLDLDFAEDRIDDCIDTLSMCTMPTLDLIVIHYILTTDMDSVIGDDSNNQIPPRWYLQDMYRDLHHQRKCFSGSQMINWILTHPVPKTDSTQAEYRQGLHVNSSQTMRGITSLGQTRHKSRVNRSPDTSPIMYDLPSAEKLAENLLLSNVIKPVDWTPLSSTTCSEPIEAYPNVVQYSASNVASLTDSLVDNKLNIDSSSNTQIYGSWSAYESCQHVRPVKRITSAPQFSLGMASQIDVQVLKEELQRHWRGRHADFDSSDDSREQTLVCDKTLEEKDDSVCDPNMTDNVLLASNYSQSKSDGLNGDIVHENDISTSSSSSTVKGATEESQVKTISTSPEFDASTVPTSSPKKGKSPRVERGQVTNEQFVISSGSESYSDSSTSAAFYNLDSKFYCFSDGADCISNFMKNMANHLDVNFFTTLKTEIQLLKQRNHCFGFQYAVQNIKPGFILKILNARRPQDSLARRFLIPAQQHSEYGLLEFTNSSSCFAMF